MKSVKSFIIFFFFVPLVATYGLLGILWRYKIEVALVSAAIFFLYSFGFGVDVLKLK